MNKRAIKLEINNGKLSSLIFCTPGFPSTETLELSLCSFGFKGYFRVSRKLREGQELLLYCSEPINKSSSKHLSANWKKAIFPVEYLNDESEVTIDICEGTHAWKKETYKLEELMIRHPRIDIDADRSVVVRSCNKAEECSFIDYILSGTNLHFIFAMDYSESAIPYLRGSKPLMLEIATSLSKELIEYSTQKSISFYAFSTAAANNHHLVSSNITTVDQLIREYGQCLSTKKHGGPTLLSPFLDHIKANIKCSDNSQKNTVTEEASKSKVKANNRISDYYCLFIVTDGAVSDIEDTIAQVVELSELPISICLIGVGDGDFTNMNMYAHY